MAVSAGVLVASAFSPVNLPPTSTPVAAEPFMDLAQFIQACDPQYDPTRSHHGSGGGGGSEYALGLDEDTYIVVGAPAQKGSQRSEEFKEYSWLELDEEWVEPTDEEELVPPTPGKSVFTRIYNLGLYTISTPVQWTVSFARFMLNAAHWAVLTGWSVCATAFKLVRLVLSACYVVPAYALYWLSAPFRFAFSLAYRLASYVASFSVVQLYFVPTAYITALAAAVGGVIGVMVGMSIVTIQYVFPNRVSTPQPQKQKQDSKSMVKEFVKKQELAITVKTPAIDELKKRQSITDYGFAAHAAAPHAAAVIHKGPPTPPSPAFLTPEASPARSSSSTGSGKAGEYYSDRDDTETENDETTTTTTTATARVFEEFADRVHEDEFHVPLYEDEDGYFDQVRVVRSRRASSESEYFGNNTAGTAGPPGGMVSPTVHMLSLGLSSPATSPLASFPSPPPAFERMYKRSSSGGGGGSAGNNSRSVSLSLVRACSSPGVRAVKEEPDSYFDTQTSAPSPVEKETAGDVTTGFANQDKAWPNSPGSTSSGTSVANSSSSVSGNSSKPQSVRDKFSGRFEVIEEESDEP